MYCPEGSYGAIGIGSAGDWQVNVDEELTSGDMSLVIDYFGGKMVLSSDHKQIQIQLSSTQPVKEVVEQLIEALEQARDDL